METPQVLTIFFDSSLKLQIWDNNSLILGAGYDRLYCWTDDHWYDLLSLLGERYVLFGWWNEGSCQLMVSKILDQKVDSYLTFDQRMDLISTHRYLVCLSERLL
jgi:hypothetical protein